MIDYNINNPGNENARWIRSAIVIDFFAELLVNGTLSEFMEESGDDIMVVLVDAFNTIYHFCPEEYQERNEAIILMLPQFEKAFPGLTQAINGGI